MRIRDTRIGRFFYKMTPRAQADALVAAIQAEKARLQSAYVVAHIVNVSRVLAAREKYASYPVKEMTRVQFGQLLAEENLGIGYLALCPIGTWFVCAGNPLLSGDKIVVGQVVNGTDLSADQLVAGLSVPERGVNKYRLAIL